MSQSDDELRQKIRLYCWGEDKVLDTNVERIMQAFAAEHARLLVSLREKMPEKFIINGKEYKNYSPIMIDKVGRELGFNGATDQALAAIDAALERLRLTGNDSNVGQPLRKAYYAPPDISKITDEHLDEMF